MLHITVIEIENTELNVSLQLDNYNELLTLEEKHRCYTYLNFPIYSCLIACLGNEI